jgi:hypothetical protein
MIKLIKKALSYLQRIAGGIFSNAYKWHIVADEPSAIKDKCIFIIKDGQEADTLIFICPCGCKAVIHLNLLPDTKPKWNYQISENKSISITPSIWRKIGCKSHFFIRNSKAIWA